ncbi:MAG: cytochrome c oxidase subunit 3 [Spongiibacteraceae bacterium]
MRNENSKYMNENSSASGDGELSGSEGLWIFVFIDMLVYGLIFMVFLLERSRSIDLFYESQSYLNKSLGLINTLILLTSSWCVVKAVSAARLNDWVRSGRFLWCAVFLGGGFAVLKIFEYYQKLNSDIDILTNSFFLFYFFMTFVHFLHVIAGILAISILAKGIKVGSSVNRIRSVENAGLFWHYVDVLWVFVFAILYLLG